MYRTRNQIATAKDLKGGISAAIWFLSREVESTITCQATPGSILAGMIRDKIGSTESGGRRIVPEKVACLSS